MYNNIGVCVCVGLDWMGKYLQVEVDYESGKIGWNSESHNRMSRLANESATWSTTALSKQLAEAQFEADPAVLHLDVQLLQVCICVWRGRILLWPILYIFFKYAGGIRGVGGGKDLIC
jgi:hypothetical protein